MLKSLIPTWSNLIYLLIGFLISSGTLLLMSEKIADRQIGEATLEGFQLGFNKADTWCQKEIAIIKSHKRIK